MKKAQSLEDINMEDYFENHQPKGKRIFILLLVLTCIFLIGTAILLWWIPYVGFTAIHPYLPWIMAGVFGSIVLFLIGGSITLILTILRGKNLFFNRKIRGVVIRFLFPLLIVIGKLIGLSKDQVRRAFITINNQLVLAESRVVSPERLLLLLPHCLQNHECSVRITGNVDNCKRCGKCKIKDLVGLSQKYHVDISIATGGTLARRIVKEKKPHLIIGVACERDLTSGIQDAYPIPVYGILNRRPNGPCYDTDVSIRLVEGGIHAFLKDD